MGLGLGGNAYAPKVIIKNDIFPREHEVYNCTSCARAEPEHPAWKYKHEETYRVKCKFNLHYNTGPRWNDIGCPNWDRKIQKPKGGYAPGIESGPYDPRDRR